MRTIIITVQVPDGCEVHVSTDGEPPITTPPPLSTRPDAAPCSCRGDCHRPDAERPDWFGKQEAAERLKRRRGTVLEGRDGA